MNQAITTTDLIAYIYDEASAELATIIQSNPDLLAQAEAMKAVDADIRAQTPMTGRPTVADEAAYLLGEVSAEKAKWLERFWSHYPFSRSDYVESFDAVPEKSSSSLLQQVGDKLQQQLEIVIAMLLPSAKSGLAVRGDHSLVQDSQPIYIVETHDLEIALYIDDDQENPKYFEMLCHLNGDEDKLPAHVQLELRHDAQLEPIGQLSGESDEAFTFTRLTADVYTLIITGDQLEIHVPNIQVK